MQLEYIEDIGDEHKMYPMYLYDHLLIWTKPSPIAVIRHYCHFLKPLALYNDLNPTKQKIWGPLEKPLIINITKILLISCQFGVF